MTRTGATTAIVVFCGPCNYFVKTAVQVGTVGTHGCAACGGPMEVYVAQGSPDAQHTPPALPSVTRRLYEALAVAWKAAGFGESDARQFYAAGMPDDERNALIRVLPETEAAWVRSCDPAAICYFCLQPLARPNPTCGLDSKHATGGSWPEDPEATAPNAPTAGEQS